MKTKKHLLIGGFLGAIFVFLFSVNFVFAQTTPTAFEECIAQGGDYDDCKTYPGAPTAGLKGAGQSCNLTSECQNGLTCYAASGVAQTTCQAISSSGITGGGGGSGGWSLGSISTFGLPGGSIMGIAVNILSWLLGLFGVIGILGFLISGIIYLTAAGDEDRMGYAKRAMQYSIIGVIVGLIGFVVIQAIDYALNTYSSF